MNNSSAGGVRCEWYWVPAAVFLFAALIIETAGYNQRLFLALHQAGWRISPVLWQLVTFLGGTLTALALLLLAARGHAQLVWSAFLAGLFSFAWSHALKVWLDVPRPPAVLGPEMLHVIGPRLKHGSFPSGHATTAFTMAGIVALRVKKWPWRLCLLALAALVGLSRITVGVHWPLDVLVGAGGGWLTAGAGIWLSTKWPAGPGVRRVLLILLLLCAVALPFVDSRYPAARWLAVGIALMTVPIGLFTLRATWRGEA
ncbi:MAG: phosphatase PAP2 family protein [Deltaproteobacteria bacterium]|nr:phosphatase PAP2 family protein [Deltaproteobacteria bacterium]